MAIERMLIDIPLLHTSFEIGYERESQLEQRANLFWERVNEFFDGYPFNFQETNVYQDGLPECTNFELSFVLNDPRFSTSPNHKLLNKLKGAGASIVWTENNKLLNEQAALLTLRQKARKPKERARAQTKYISQSRELWGRRDTFSASRIRETLSMYGVLLMGGSHSVAELLKDEMRIVIPRNIFEVLPPNYQRTHHYELI